MEDSLHISGVDNDESFAMLYASLDFAKTSNTDELTEVGFLLGKLADIRGKYDSVCNIIAVDMETMEEKHREGIAALDNKYDAMNEKFEELIHELTQEMEVKDANLNAATDQNNALMLLVVSIRKLIADFFADSNRKSLPQLKNEHQVENDSIPIDDDSENEIEIVDGEVEEVQPPANDEGTEEVQSNDGDQMTEAGENEQNESNGIGHDETVDQKIDENENVRAQSTPIAKVEAADNVNDAVPAVINTDAIDNVSDNEEPTSAANDEDVSSKNGSSNMVSIKKRYPCPICHVSFNKMNTILAHLARDHVKPSLKPNKQKLSKRKRQPFNVDDEDDIDDNGEHYRYAVVNPTKRQKTGQHGAMKRFSQ